MEKDKQQSPALPIARGMLLLVAAALLMKLTIDAGIGYVMAGRGPTIALRYAPYNPDALANQAARSLQQATPDSIHRAGQLALEAIRRTPVKASAYSVLGYVADANNQPEKAEHLIDFSSRLSRRSLLAHLWFIEKYSAQGNIDQTLHHYDQALKTSADAFAILLPILIEAAKDPAIQPPLTKLLASDPVWADTFLRDLIIKSDAPEALVMLAKRLQRAGHPLNAERQLQLMTRLVTNQRFDEAATVMGLTTRTAVSDGNFRQTNSFGPFSWNLTGSYAYGAGREEQPTGKHVLKFFAERSAGGEVARQLLVLPSGRYRLSTRASYSPESTGAHPSWRLICAGAERQLLAVLDIPPAPKPIETSAIFSVPVGCSGQWLALQLQPSDDIDEISGQVEQIKISPIS